MIRSYAVELEKHPGDIYHLHVLQCEIIGSVPGVGFVGQFASCQSAVHQAQARWVEVDCCPRCLPEWQDATCH